jgi:quercetin dioxygenase-like cupin family protein
MGTIVLTLRRLAKQAFLSAALSGAIVMMAPVIAPAEDAVSMLIKQSLADMPGKAATVITVDYAPGAASDPHVHPGSVFVLEGAVTTQLEGESPKTYSKGQHWYEPPKKPHVVSKNASSTESAKLLVFLLSQEGEKIKKPVESRQSGN